MNNNKLIPLGKIIKSHGIKGELKVFLYNDVDESIVIEGINIWVKFNGLNKNFFLESIRGSINNRIIKIKSINDRNNSEIFFNKEFYILRLDFPDIKGDSFYFSDLIGLSIIDKKDNRIGVVIDVVNIKDNNLILFEYNGKNVFIPIVDDFVELFDLKNKIIKVKNIKTLLNL